MSLLVFPTGRCCPAAGCQVADHLIDYLAPLVLPHSWLGTWAEGGGEERGRREGGGERRGRRGERGEERGRGETERRGEGGGGRIGESRRE